MRSKVICNNAITRKNVTKTNRHADDLQFVGGARQESIMLKHFSSEASVGSDEEAPTGGDTAGQEPAGYRAWTDMVSASDQPGAGANGVSADLALVGDTFIFESSWTNTDAEIAASDSEVLLVEQSSSSAGEFASQMMTADGSNSFELADSHDIPIWGLTSDDFSFI
jgi:hypothetical protein